jgi:hypothetical protein
LRIFLTKTQAWSLGKSFVGIPDACAKNTHERRWLYVDREKRCPVFRAGHVDEGDNEGQREKGPSEARSPVGYSFGEPLPSLLSAFAWRRCPAPDAL